MSVGLHEKSRESLPEMPREVICLSGWDRSPTLFGEGSFQPRARQMLYLKVQKSDFEGRGTITAAAKHPPNPCPDPSFNPLPNPNPNHLPNLKLGLASISF